MIYDSEYYNCGHPKCFVRQECMNVSEECAIYIFTFAMKMETVCSSESFLPVYHTVRHQNPGDVDYLCLDTGVYIYIYMYFFLMALREHLCLVT